MTTILTRGPLALLAVVLMLSACGQPSGTSRTFSLTYAAEVTDVPPGTRVLDLWLPVPQDTADQKITDLTVVSSFGHELTVDPVHGNRMVHLRVPRPPRSLSVSYTCTATRHEATVPKKTGRGIDESLALKPNRLVPVDGEVRRLAMMAVGSFPDRQSRADQSRADQSRALYDHTLDHLKYDKSGTGWGRGDFQHACDIATGNCTDFHAYFIGLSRSLGIPAHFEIGLSLPPKRGEGELKGYHCWAWYMADGGWSPVDISEADKDPSKTDYFYGSLCENRIALSKGRDLRLNPPQKGDPLNYFVHPYCEVDGKTHETVTRLTSFKDHN